MKQVKSRKMGGTVSAPNEWFFKERWRQVFPWDARRALEARKALADEGLHPTRDLAPDPGLATFEANHRAALHQITDELSRTDLAIIFELARLLIIVPRDDAIFGYIKRRSDEMLSRHGLL